MGYYTMLLVGHYQHSIFQITKIVLALENMYNLGSELFDVGKCV